jgi:tetratricopeptide (TPR) repeat protein
MNPRSSVPLVALGLAAVSLFAFAPAFDNGFVNLDDDTYVQGNPYVLGGLSARNAARAFEFRAANWHPLTWLSLQLDASLWGTSGGPPGARGYHVTNVLLHAANAALLFLALFRLTGRQIPAAVVALLFAVHPLRVESVAWVSERKDVLGAFFGLLALRAYAAYAGRPSARRYLAVAAAFAGSLLAKPMLVTLPCLLLVLDWWPLGRIRGGGRQVAWLAAEKLPLAALAAASCVVTWAAQRSFAASSLELVPFGARIANAVVSYTAYLVQAFYPLGLAPFYPLSRSGPPAVEVAASAVLLAAVTAISAAQARAQPYLLAGWLWYLGTLVPVIGLVQVGAQARADRYTYVPLIGVAVMLVWGANELARRYRLRTVALAAAGGTAVVLTVVCREQVRRWQDDLTLWPYTLHVTGDNWIAHWGIAAAEQREAERQAALRIPDGVQGFYEAAIRDYQEAVRLNPRNALLRAQLGTVYHTLKRYDQARSCYEQALALDQKFAQAHANLGALLRTCGDQQGALTHLKRATELDPDNPATAIAWYNLGAVLQGREQLEEAAEAYRQAVRLNRGSAAYQTSLDNVLDAIRRARPGSR